VVFLGGTATGFHITDKAEPEIRATKDVDIIVEIASRVDYHQLEKTLRELGFFQKDELFIEALPGHLLPDQASQGRRSIILERINIIVQLSSH